MKIDMIYDSKYGNGEKLCKYIEKKLEGLGHEPTTFLIKETEPKEIPEADLYIFSAPTHIGSIPFRMKRYLRKMEFPPGAKVAFISTCLDKESKAVEKMRKRLAKKDIQEVGNGLKIKVKGMKGPLEEGYEEKVDDFLDRIIG